MLNSLLVTASKQLRWCLLSKNAILSGVCPPASGRTLGANVWLMKQHQTRWLQTSCCLRREDRRRVKQKYSDVADGETSTEVDSSQRQKYVSFPDADTPNRVYDGVKFSDLNIVHIKVSKNNTIMAFTNNQQGCLFTKSCGTEGFKNAKKGTNIAAQATGIAVGMKVAEVGLKNIRVMIQGLGPGRSASIKGLQMAGMNIVSITDHTPSNVNCPRPRKVRRV